MLVFLKSTGLFGFILFALLFSVTFGLPESVEQSAKGFVKNQIAIELDEKFHEAKNTSVAKKAASMADKLGLRKAKLVSDLEHDLPNKIASVIASMCGYDCEKKKRVAAAITKEYLAQIASLNAAQYNLGEIIKGKYMEMIENLRFDLRIFLGANAISFLILVILAFLKPKAVSQLLLPGLLLLTATITASSIYLFGQDWFYTILYNDYMGFGYIAYLSIIFGFLMDVTFNQARVTSEIINAFFNAIGSSFTCVPC